MTDQSKLDGTNSLTYLSSLAKSISYSIDPSNLYHNKLECLSLSATWLRLVGEASINLPLEWTEWTLLG